MAATDRKTFNFQLDTPADRTWLDDKTTEIGFEKSSLLMRAAVRAMKRMNDDQFRDFILVQGRPEGKEK